MAIWTLKELNIPGCIEAYSKDMFNSDANNRNRIRRTP